MINMRSIHDWSISGIMFRVRAKGKNWLKLRSILQSYNRRIDFVRLRVVELMGRAFLEELRKIAPNEPEYRKYIESLRLVRLEGSNGVAAYGVVTGDMKELIGDVLSDTERSERTVVYVGVSNSTVPDDAAMLMSQNNPWPIQMLPEQLPDGVTLVHRVVSQGEMEWAIEKTRSFVKQNVSYLRDLDLQFGDLGLSKTSKSESMPDNFTLALRAEFGINTDAKPHWRPAIKWLRVHMKDILMRDDQIKKALGYWLFRGHLLANEVESETIVSFQDKYGDFQKKVIVHG
jgi:hypothetical protein